MNYKSDSNYLLLEIDEDSGEYNDVYRTKIPASSLIDTYTFEEDTGEDYAVSDFAYPGLPNESLGLCSEDTGDDADAFLGETLNSRSNIARVWSWPTVSMPYNRQRRAVQIESIQMLGITDIVQTINSIADARRRTNFNFSLNHSSQCVQTALQSVLQDLRTTQSGQPYSSSFHLMVYPSPVPSFMSQMIREIIALVRLLRPRSVLLDAEDNWRESARRRNGYPTGDYSQSLDMVRRHLIPGLHEYRCPLGFADFLTNDPTAIDLAELCDYIMPLAYSTNRRFSSNRVPSGAWEIQVINGFGRKTRLRGKPIVPALAAWDLLRPANNPSANAYDSMKYVLEQVEQISNPVIREVAWWSLPKIYGSNGRTRSGHKWRFMQELCRRTRGLFPWNASRTIAILRGGRGTTPTGTAGQPGTSQQPAGTTTTINAFPNQPFRKHGSSTQSGKCT